MTNNVAPPTSTDQACCYNECPEPGTIPIASGNPDSQWICRVHYDKWNADRDRFLADGKGCAMQQLGELLERDEFRPKA